eukprot:COSAG02_NODE_26020_length_643_cov_0.761029_1_plen_29_part_10
MIDYLICIIAAIARLISSSHARARACAWN